MLLAGCSGEPEIRRPFLSDIVFSISEEYLNDGIVEPTLVLNIKTKDNFPCINYSIKIESQFEDRILTVGLLATEIENVCFTAIGPAQVTVPLDEITSRIVFKNGNLVDVYNLSIDIDAIRISVVDSSFSAPNYYTYFRYPENSFACICGTYSDFPSICDDFNSELLSKIPSLREFQFGNGVLPYPDSSSGHWINTPSTFFIYLTDKDFQTAGEVLSDFTEKNITLNSGISIRLTNWKNQHFNSW